MVVIDESGARDSRPIETLGHYDPGRDPSVFEVNKEKTLEWIKKGAEPSAVVRKYLGKAGVLPPVDYSKYKKHSSKKKGEEVQAAQAPAEEKKQP